MKQILLLVLFLAIAGLAESQTTVTLTLPDPCASVDVEETQKTDVEFNVHPNPTDGRFTLHFAREEAIGRVSLEVTDMNGNSLLSEQLYSGNREMLKSFDWNALPKGTYLISLSGENYSETRKIVIN